MIVRTYFHNAQGLQRHAKVRANGLDAGTVKDVNLSTHSAEQPVEVLLGLNSRYAGRIPADSTAMIETEGLLGAPYVALDVSGATGSPVSSNGVLKGVDARGMAEVVQGYLNAAIEQSRKLAEESEKLRQTIDSANSRTKQ